MDLRQTGLEGVDWIHFVQVADSCEHGTELSGSIKGGKFLVLDHLSFLRRTLIHGVSYPIYVLHLINHSFLTSDEWVQGVEYCQLKINSACTP
jgi:hypothetical protein